MSRRLVQLVSTRTIASRLLRSRTSSKHGPKSATRGGLVDADLETAAAQATEEEGDFKVVLVRFGVWALAAPSHNVMRLRWTAQYGDGDASCKN